ncbi:MAG: cysteine desulfurase family protein [Balneolaceae bacterium]
MKTIYFDHAATTPLAPEVLEAMLPYLKSEFGNASSPHNIGHRANVALEDAREQAADLLNAEPSEIIFTSGGTESDNAAIKGVFECSGNRKRIITSPLEHHAVLHSAESAKRHGGQPVYLTPGPDGKITPDQVESAIDSQTALVSLMHVNNEIGTVNPIREIAAVCRHNSVPLHTDAVQSVGKIDVDVKELDIDLLSLSGHKLYGPKGVGILYVRNGTPWIPWMQGGSQERNRRGGTSNIPGIVGLVKALDLAISERERFYNHASELRKQLLDLLEKQFRERVQINGPADSGVPHILNIGLIPPGGKRLDGEMLLLNLDIEGVCVSNGSACTSGAVEPSHVLTGVGIDDAVAESSLRISFGRKNSLEEVGIFVEKLTLILNRMTAAA